MPGRRVATGEPPGYFGPDRARSARKRGSFFHGPESNLRWAMALERSSNALAVQSNWLSVSLRTAKISAIEAGETYSVPRPLEQLGKNRTGHILSSRFEADFG